MRGLVEVKPKGNASTLKTILDIHCYNYSEGRHERTFWLILPNRVACMLFGVVIAAVLLLIASNDEVSWQIFIGQESGENRPEEERFSSGLLFGCLFGTPFILFFAAILTWLFSPIINFLLTLP